MGNFDALLITFCLGFVLQAEAQTVSEKPDAPAVGPIRQGAEAMTAGKFAEAERWFQTAVTQDPESGEARMELGIAELRLGKPEEATQSLREAIARNPNAQGVNLFLGR